MLGFVCYMMKTPNWYCITMLVVILYGLIANTLVDTFSFLSSVNLYLTWFILLFNIVSLGIFVFGRYEKLSFILPVYLIGVNSWALWVFFMQIRLPLWVADIFMVTKIIIIVFLSWLLVRHYQDRWHLGDV